MAHGHPELSRSLLLAHHVRRASCSIVPQSPDFSPLDSPHGLESPLPSPAHNIHSPSHSLHSASHSHSLRSLTHAMHAAAPLYTHSAPPRATHPRRRPRTLSVLPHARTPRSQQGSGDGGAESFAYQQQLQQLQAQRAGGRVLVVLVVGEL
ncbi:hypothetical protein C8R44DRAFT_894249 [Mycena epipterygia]|nr:hypothetical protein C8R44DRAFT_894249 [Mycena epipterygia]